MSTNTVTISFATDDGYAPYLCLAMFSALSFLAAERACHVVIMDCGISDFWRNRLMIICRERENTTLEFLSVRQLDAVLDGLFEKRGKKGKVTAWSYTTYYRLFLSSLLPDCRRIIYLDVDMIVRGDLSVVYDMDMQGKSIACVTDVCLCYAKESLESRERMAKCGQDMTCYFNAGFLLIDLDAWRRMDFEKRMADAFCSLDHLIYPDQDILNVLFKGDALRLGMEWNFLIPCITSDKTLPPDIIEHRDEIMQQQGWKIIHFAGPKPWTDPIGVPMADIWWQMARDGRLDADIAAHESRLIRHYLIAQREAARVSSLRLQIWIAKLKLFFCSKKKRLHLEGKLARLRQKYANAIKNAKRKLK